MTVRVFVPGILGLLFFASSCSKPAESLAIENKVFLKVDGSGRMVSGSMHLLGTPSGLLLVDCGAYYGDDAGEDSETANRKLPEGVEQAKALLITHAHADHIGRIPLLYEAGFRAPIYATPASIAMMKVTFLQNARYSNDPKREWSWSKAKYNDFQDGTKLPVTTTHWNKGCEWSQKISAKNRGTLRGGYDDLVRHIALSRSKVSPCKVCAEIDARGIMQLCRPIRLRDQFRPFAGVVVSAWNTGHLPGAVSFHVTVALDAGKTTSILFSGDVGPRETMIQHSFDLPPPADVVLMETTYGDKTSNTANREEWSKFRTELINCLAAGKTAWIPSFALDRTEKVLFQLETAMNEAEDRLTKVPRVFVPSPSANEYHRLYRSGDSSWLLKSEYLEAGGLAREFESRMPDEVYLLLDAIQAEKWGVRNFARPADVQREAMQSLTGNVLITTSGMVDSVFSRSLLEPLISSDQVVVFLVGYQDPATPGGSIENATKVETNHILVEGQPLTLNARPMRMQGFSGHGKADDLDHWLSQQSKESRILLVHGDPPSLEARKTDLARKGWQNVDIPQQGDVMTLFELPE